MSEWGTIRVKYHECDMQRVVFNANYWVYADDVVAEWMRALLGAGDLAASGFDFMLKTATGTWHKGATYGDTIRAVPSVTRWGNTSFDVAVAMTVDGAPCFDAVITYVSVTPGTHTPCPVPEKVRSALG